MIIIGIMPWTTKTGAAKIFMMMKRKTGHPLEKVYFAFDDKDMLVKMGFHDFSEKMFFTVILLFE